MIIQNALELIGNTPTIQIDGTNIYVKLEKFNFGGSIKDRAALGMIGDAERKGFLKPGSVIIEPTSGNTGIGLAFICASKGYKLILVMPETVTKERVQIVKGLGAEVLLTEQSKGMKGSIEKAKELLSLNKNYVMPLQFENLANPEIHRKTTAIEILNDTDGQLDFFIAGVGTGGTITGTGEVLKSKNKNIKIIAVEPKGSPMLSKGISGSHKIQGIGAGFIPDVLNKGVIDEVFQVDNEDAFEFMRALAKEEGILVGISSAAVVKATVEIAKRPENEGKTIVTLLPDSGERYLSMDIY